MIILHKLSYNFNLVSRIFKYSLLATCLSISELSYGIDTQENNFFPSPPPYSSLFPNSVPLSHSSSSVANPSSVPLLPSIKRKIDSVNSSADSERPTKRECYTRPLEISSKMPSSYPPYPQTSSSQQFKGETEKPVTAEISLSSNSFFNCARSIKGEERYRAADYIAKLVLRRDLQGESVLMSFIESNCIEERLTASRALWELICCHDNWAKEVVYTSASSLYRYQRETIKYTLVQLFAIMHDWAFEVINTFAHSKDYGKKLMVKETLGHYIENQNPLARQLVDNILLSHSPTQPSNAIDIICTVLTDYILINNEEAKNIFTSLLRSSQAPIHHTAAQYLKELIVKYNNLPLEAKSTTSLFDSNAAFREAALRASILSIDKKEPKKSETLEDLIKSSDPALMTKASEILASLIVSDIEKAEGILGKLFHSSKEREKEIAVESLRLSSVTSEEAQNLIITMVVSKKQELKEIGGKVLMKLLEDENSWARSVIKGFNKSSIKEENEASATVLCSLIDRDNNWAKCMMNRFTLNKKTTYKDVAVMTLVKLLQQKSEWGLNKLKRWLESDREYEREIAEQVEILRQIP